MFKNFAMLPSVVIGMPIHNGMPYLQRALDSVLAQEYPNLSVYISDNASTDGTSQILADYARRDSRIIYVKNQTNVGSLQNFRSVVTNTKSDLFMWAAHDDIWPTDFVQKAVEIFVHSPDLLCLVNTRTTLIDAFDAVLPEINTRPQLIDLRNLNYPARIAELAKRVGWNIYGLIRRVCLERTSLLHANQMYHDVILTYELAGMGAFAIAETSEPFKYRFVIKDPTKTAQSLGPETVVPQRLVTEMYLDCVSAIRTAPVSLSERAEALHSFKSECARHGEWWPGIAVENGWDISIPDSLRNQRLEQLLWGDLEAQ